MKVECKPVKYSVREVVIPTYEPCAPDRNPMFLEKRVYQGSSGRVYPLPFTDRISQHATPRKWKAIYIENDFLEVMILPEIGGRIHAILDKTTGHDLIYRQSVIKPALVGLAGSWISGGIEFNWAQHHRPATFMPVDFEIEEGDDESITVWLGDHEPMNRMKAMHGVCLHRDRAFLELKVRLFNRTPFTQTFLWWANAAVRVHEGYQSFFPPDVAFVADHAKRAVSSFPLCTGKYYGVDYANRANNGVPEDERPAKFHPPRIGDRSASIPDYEPNDLSWYANIPVPTSYMCVDSQGDFFGGYDHLAQTGLVHVADHHIAPGKKQWTWGNHEFGYAWDRNLSDDEGPYIELMAGVFTDNQPDFSFLAPYETREWSQYWYGIHKIGVPQNANTEAAVSLRSGDKTIEIGVSVTSVQSGAVVRLRTGKKKTDWKLDIAPGLPFVRTVKRSSDEPLGIVVLDSFGREIISYFPDSVVKISSPDPATEPPQPGAIESNELLYLTGRHLEQYRHATRDPEDYWLEAIRRDPGDSRCNNALGIAALRRGQFAIAEGYFRKAIERLTERNPNPPDGEPNYHLGLAIRYPLDGDTTKTELFDEAYSAFYKATWNHSTAAPAFFALAEMDCLRADWPRASEHLNRSLDFSPQNSTAKHLKVLVLRKLGQKKNADELLLLLLKDDPLDMAAQYLAGNDPQLYGQTRLDIAHDLSRAGFYDEAITILEDHKPNSDDPRELGSAPMIGYTLGWLYAKNGSPTKAKAAVQKALKRPQDYCFPNRLEEIAVLEFAIKIVPNNATPYLHLGNLLYDRRRYSEAISLWKSSSRLDPRNAIAWRNLGIAYFNILRSPRKASSAYEKAFAADSSDARILYERDQLWKRLGLTPQKRLRELEKHSSLVAQRDDLTIELGRLLNLNSDHEAARSLLASRHFQPWEGGEGLALDQHVRTYLSLGKLVLAKGNGEGALTFFKHALEAPKNLGEAKHLLANQADIYYFLGRAADLAGDRESAQTFWHRSAMFTGDFQEMSVRQFSEMTFYSAMSLKSLGKLKRSERLLRDLVAFAKKLERIPARIDYFATSLPAMLLFEADLQADQTATARFMLAQALMGLGEKKKARRLISELVKLDHNHSLAIDFGATFL